MEDQRLTKDKLVEKHYNQKIKHFQTMHKKIHNAKKYNYMAARINHKHLKVICQLMKSCQAKQKSYNLLTKPNLSLDATSRNWQQQIQDCVLRISKPKYSDTSTNTQNMQQKSLSPCPWTSQPNKNTSSRSFNPVLCKCLKPRSSSPFPTSKESTSVLFPHLQNTYYEKFFHPLFSDSQNLCLL